MNPGPKPSSPDCPWDWARISAVGDLYALARCDYIMGPPSTYTQWASFYGNAPLFHLFTSSGHLELGKFRVSFLEEIP